MQNKTRGIRINDTDYAFMQEIYCDYSANLGEFISGLFHYARTGLNPENGNNIKQFFDDVQTGKWINRESKAYKLQEAQNTEYAAFCTMMDTISDGTLWKEIARDYIISEQSPKSFWQTKMGLLTNCQNIILNESGVAIMVSDFIRYFSEWLHDAEESGKLAEIKKDIIAELYRKHHPLDEFIEEEA